MNTASRLQHEAPVGGVVVGERTYRFGDAVLRVGATGPRERQGEAAPIPIWCVLGVRPEHERAPLAPLIGRGRELELLGAVWDKVRADRRTHLVTVFGPPGIGKSRLVRELRPRLEREGVFIKGRCRPYGETTGYGAFGQQVSQIAGIFETDPTNVARAKLRERAAALLPDMDADGGGRTSRDPPRTVERGRARQAAPVLLRASVRRSRCPNAPDDLGVRGHPLGRAGAPGAPGVARLTADRRTDVPDHAGPAGSPRRATDVGRGARAVHGGPPGAARRRGRTRARGRAARRVGGGRGLCGPSRPRERRQPAVPRGAGGVRHRAHGRLRRRAADDGAGDHRRPLGRAPTSPPASAPGRRGDRAHLLAGSARGAPGR